MPGATIGPDKTIFDLEIDAFKKVVDLNLFGTVLPTMVFAKAMVKQKKGSIINISSESALRPLTRVVGYSASKAAVTNFTKYMATELATKFGEGLRVNAMAPDFSYEQNRTLMTNPDGSLTARGEKIIANTPFVVSTARQFWNFALLASDLRICTGTLQLLRCFDAFSI
jgi:NAD(P)-dependent dehydrogenase (short-subunit alcohol dehydrogenase family)